MADTAEYFEEVRQQRKFNGAQMRSTLKEQGYLIVPDVIPHAECDKYIDQYKKWLNRFGESVPYQEFSIIFHYRVAHYEPSWKVRMWVKPVFSAIWDTDKLLSSMDAIAIGQPPEIGNTKYRQAQSFWFHLDQGSWREGLHAYQGAVYLEETTEEDHCFRVIENSFKHHKEFYTTFPDAAEKAAREDFFRLSSEYIDWFKSRGCQEKLLPVPKGGMVLWDSRMIHDNVAPMHNRKHSDRWRFVNFVSMTPATWAHEDDYSTKRKAYNELVASAHWSSQGVYLFPCTSDAKELEGSPHIEAIEELPDIAKTKQAKQLAGIEKYNYNDGHSNGPEWRPKWLNANKYEI